MSFGALAGPPISGAINTATGGFTAVGVYAGKPLIFRASCEVRFICSYRNDGDGWSGVDWRYSPLAETVSWENLDNH